MPITHTVNSLQNHMMYYIKKNEKTLISKSGSHLIIPTEARASSPPYGKIQISYLLPQSHPFFSIYSTYSSINTGQAEVASS